MKIAKNVVPSIAYQVRTQDGVLVDEATCIVTGKQIGRAHD